MLKIIIDPKPMLTDNQVRYHLRKAKEAQAHLPYSFVPGGTLALSPGWCEYCNDERTWIPYGGTSGCVKCRAKWSTNGNAGFARVLDEA